VDPSGHHARRLTREQLTEADLVLTATVEQRRDCLNLVPLAMNRTFTLREFVRLVPAADGQGVDPAGRIAAIAAVRGSVPPPSPDADTITDPFGATPDFARRTVADIQRLVDVVAEVVTGTSAGS
jgi:protein-tyrosine phosphatase